MAYRKFQNLEKVVEQFGLVSRKAFLFNNCPSIEPSEWLKRSFEYAQNQKVVSEKERSERIVSPVLGELSFRNPKITIYSGRDMNVDSKLGLNGECDFLLSYGTIPYFLQAPIFSLVEAKKQDIEWGSAQCLAQMIGAQRFNKERENPIKAIYGCSTNAENWQFMKLVGNTLTFHDELLFLNQIDRILGLMQCIFDEFRAENGLD